MSDGLNVNRLVSVSIDFGTSSAQYANVNSLCIIGSTDVIDVNERMRSYDGLDEIAEDFGSTDPEYKAAAVFFNQDPQPEQLYIGRWAQTATAGLVRGAVLTASEQLTSAWTGITDGSFNITIDAGTATDVTGLDFSSITTMSGVAAVITAALSGATCTWVGDDHFVITSSTTGTDSSVSYLSTASSGTDISEQLALTSSTADSNVTGVEAETPLECIEELDDLSTIAYAYTFALSSTDDITDDEHIEVAEYIEGTSNAHLYGITGDNTLWLSSTQTSTLPLRLQALEYDRTMTQYSTSSIYAVASIFGREFTVDFDGNNTVITVMWKTEPDVTPETLKASYANALDAANVNYYAYFNNDTSIIVNGCMASGLFLDEIHGADWLQNRIQTDVFNALYTTTTKIPQTDAGNAILKTTIENGLDQAVTNGYVAPGTWNNTGFGTLSKGDYLSSGYYVYVPSIDSQSQSDRESRVSVSIQVAAKLAGAIHTVDIAVTINR